VGNRARISRSPQSERLECGVAVWKANRLPCRREADRDPEIEVLAVSNLGTIRKK